MTYPDDLSGPTKTHAIKCEKETTTFNPEMS